MAKRNCPGGFIAVLPGEVIEIPQDGGKSWLTLFYCLPKELAGKWKPALDLPRCPYEVLRTDRYDSIVCDDMFKLLVWDCYSWSAWQFFQVKDYNGPRNPDHDWKKGREHGRIGESTERGNKPWHEQRTARSSKQNWFWRY